MNNAEIVDLAHQNLMNTYGCVPLAFVRGTGAYLYDADGNRYLDFFCGLAVTSLGHSHPRVVRAIKEQAEKLTHVSNVFHTEPMARLAARLCGHFGDGRLFFCNSGAEANEAALKLARRWGHDRGAGRFEVVSTLGSFHGRTFGTLSATGQEKYHIGFQPLLPGFRLVPYDDVDALDKAIRDETVAIMIEPIQGEGGVRLVPPAFLRGLREICDRHGLLLIFDEVQTGVGRTGRFYAYEHCGIHPDILTSAKGIGGGFPMSVCLATADAARGLTVGVHGTTFGGNPLAMAVGNATLDIILAPGFLERVARLGLDMRQRLAELKDRHGDVIEEIRGEGLLIGLKLRVPPASFAEEALKQRLLVIPAGDNVVRVLPPLVVSDEDIAEGLRRLDAACAALEERLMVAIN